MMKSAVIFPALLSLTLTANSVVALTLVESREALGKNDFILWDELGIFNPFEVPPDVTKFLSFNFDINSQSGKKINVNIDNIDSPSDAVVSPPFVFRTDTPPDGVEANFGLGDAVLFTGLDSSQFPAPGNPGPITLTFNKSVRAVGTQIAVDDTFNFTIFADIYDKQNTLLQTFSLPGTSSTTIDNSAVFLGVKSDIPNIHRVVYRSDISNRAFGINQVDLVSVPEGNLSVGLIVLGNLGLIAMIPSIRDL
ncbi:MAG: hypothetical protein AB4041_13150 [Microcystaceae cyanobacterium]